MCKYHSSSNGGRIRITKSGMWWQPYNIVQLNLDKQTNLDASVVNSQPVLGEQTLNKS